MSGCDVQLQKDYAFIGDTAIKRSLYDEQMNNWAEHIKFDTDVKCHE